MAASNSSIIPRQDLARFMYYVSVDQNTGAWFWTGGISSSGYGAFWHQGATILAHRFAWMAYRGNIPKGMHVCHKYEEYGRHNVNPDHLFLGDGFANMQDASSKGRLAYGEKNSQKRLTVQQARDIYADPRPITEIAKEYPVSQAVVCNIKRGNSWRHATGASPVTTHSRRNKSGYIGVSWAKSNQKWLAGIRWTAPDGKKMAKHLGLFDNPEDAARAYDCAALDIHGPLAKTNF